MAVLAKWKLACLALVSAMTLTLMSSSVERLGPELAVYGNLCGPRQNDLCYKPVLKSGFPVAYLFDAPGVSIERQLGLEDKLSVGAFALNVALYSVLFLLAFRVVWYGQAKRFLMTGRK